MSTFDMTIDSLRHSPRLPEAIDLLQRELAEERQRREKFYQEMTPEQKVEFIDGEVVLHSPARFRRLDVTKFTLKVLDAYVDTRDLGTVQSEKCLCVFPRNDHEPDIVFFGNEKASSLLHETLKFPIPDLIVEVLSESTEARDRGVKFEDYAAGGVCEYWIINADDSVIEQYVLRSNEYELVLKSSSGRLRSEAIEGFTTDVEALFDRKANREAIRSLMT